MRLQQRADVHPGREAHHPRPVGQHLDHRRLGRADPQERAGLQLAPRPHQGQPLARGRVVGGLRARAQQQQLGAPAALAHGAQAGAHHARLVEHQHVARAQQGRKVGEGAVRERVPRPEHEQPGRFAARRGLARDQRLGQRVVVGRDLARAAHEVGDALPLDRQEQLEPLLLLVAHVDELNSRHERVALAGLDPAHLAEHDQKGRALEGERVARGLGQVLVADDAHAGRREVGDRGPVEHRRALVLDDDLHETAQAQRAGRGALLLGLSHSAWFRGSRRRGSRPPRRRRQRSISRPTGRDRCRVHAPSLR